MTFHRLIKTGLLTIVVALGVSCSDLVGHTPTDSTDANTDTGPSPDTSTVDTVTDGSPDGDTGGPDCTIEATLPSLAAEYFEKSCNFGSCHGDQKAGGLDLRSDVAHANLINIAATSPGAGGKFLVVPGDPDASFLVQKVENPGAGEGALMPMGATESMDPGCRIAMLRAWIADGANP